jgi:hypothetical protein
MADELLDRAAIIGALTMLGDRLARRGIVADLYVFGGAAMSLAYDSRRATRDIDALLTPHGVVVEEARAVARELGLPDSWLNDQGSVYVAPGDDDAALVFDHPGLRVSAASPRHLLAMKVLASRAADREDIRHLAGRLNLTTAAAILAVCASVFPAEVIPGRARILLEDMFAKGAPGD